jgi:hypothetical protein
MLKTCLYLSQGREDNYARRLEKDGSLKRTVVSLITVER